MNFENNPIADRVEKQMRSLQKSGVKLNAGSEYNRVFEAFYDLFKRLDESEPSPCEDVQSNDMTAREFFDSPESPVTLDKICSPVEKEFLLDTIEMYAKGKVHQALKGQQTVGEDVQRMAELEVEKQGWGKYEGTSEQVGIKNAFLAGYAAHPPAPAGMEEAVSSIAPTDLRIKEKAEEFLNEYASDFPPGNATCFAAGAKWMKDMLLTASTPPAKEQTSKLPGVDNTQVKPSDPQMVKEVP